MIAGMKVQPGEAAQRTVWDAYVAERITPALRAARNKAPTSNDNQHRENCTHPAEEDHASARAAKALVRGGGHNVAQLKGLQGKGGVVVEM